MVFFFNFYAVKYSFAVIFVSGKYCSTVFLSVKQGKGSDEIRNACKKWVLHHIYTSRELFIFQIHKIIGKLCSGVEKNPFICLCVVFKFYH